MRRTFDRPMVPADLGPIARTPVDHDALRERALDAIFGGHDVFVIDPKGHDPRSSK